MDKIMNGRENNENYGFVYIQNEGIGLIMKMMEK